MTQWLTDAVLYEIYPQSFADSNGDGIGDLRGVIDRLDHLAWLGIDAIWFNPCFASPFADAGYDVSDYLTIAPRYGTNDDLVELVDRARERGIRVILDLVVGHTSVEHTWFQAELQAAGPHSDGDRYVWCDDPPHRDTTGDLPGTAAWVRSPGPRPGWYLKNFYDAQPALNFGWGRLPADEPWRDAVDAPGPRRNRASLREIMSFWLDKGVSGFRVDMAFSLVKDDEGTVETVALWRELRSWLDEAYPDAVLLPEGPEPRAGQSLAFHADFFLVIFEAHASLFDNGYAGRLPFHPPRPAFFDAEGCGSTEAFLEHWAAAKAAAPDRPVLLSTADHDYDRLRCGPRGPEQLGAAYTFLLTWGSVPCIYYGDEIGMRYLPDLPDVEGAICNPAYNRAGCRTPMQWDDGPNAGFSTAAASTLYLPVDPAPDRPTVAAQRDDPASTLSLVRRLLALRTATPALGARADVRVVHAGYPFTYVRGGTHLVVVNPRREPATVEVPGAGGARSLESSGVTLAGDTLPADVVEVAGFGYGVFELAG
jgi:maltose alpha-D-glucosyltransferase/alpha-amylase